MPFVWGKSENRTFWNPAIADTDLAIGQARHLDAVPVGETQGALNPVRTRNRPFGYVFLRRFSHVSTSLIVVCYPEMCNYLMWLIAYLM